MHSVCTMQMLKQKNAALHLCHSPRGQLLCIKDILNVVSEIA